MAVHAVPQDVEAEDKLIGFLSLKQFIFTVIGLGFGYLTFFFFTKVHPVSAIIWVPFTVFFLTLGLYQRKDQPAEVFLASAIGFYLKPKVRIWSQDGYEERVKITAPPVIEKHYTKDFTGEEASNRLSHLSLMMDSRGWASKRIDDWQNPNLAASAQSTRLVGMQDVAVTQGIDPAKYTQPADPYDESSLVMQDFDQRIEQNTNAVREDALRTLATAQQATTVQQPSIAPATVAPLTTPQQDEDAAAAVIAASHQDDIPSIRQKVVEPTKVVEAEAAQPHPEAIAAEPAPHEQIVLPAEEAAPIAPEPEVGVARETEDGSVEISLH